MLVLPTARHVAGEDQSGDRSARSVAVIPTVVVHQGGWVELEHGIEVGGVGLLGVHVARRVVYCKAGFLFQVQCVGCQVFSHHRLRVR